MNHTISKADGTKVLRTIRSMQNEIESKGIQVDECQYVYNTFRLRLSKGFDCTVGHVQALFNLVQVFIGNEYKYTEHFSCSNNHFHLVVERR